MFYVNKVRAPVNEKPGQFHNNRCDQFTTFVISDGSVIKLLK